MKNGYFFALIAPVLLFTSCQVIEGDEREPMDVGKYIARRTIQYYFEILQEYLGQREVWEY